MTDVPSAITAVRGPVLDSQVGSQPTKLCTTASSRLGKPSYAHNNAVGHIFTCGDTFYCLTGRVHKAPNNGDNEGNAG